MKIKIKGKEVELKYTYNSTLNMENINLEEIENVSPSNLFVSIRFIKELLEGAVNNDPKVKFSEEDVIDFLDNGDYIMEELAQFLVEEFANSKLFSVKKTTKK